MFIEENENALDMTKGWCIDGSDCIGFYYIYDENLRDLNQIDYQQCTSKSKIRNYTVDHHRSMLYVKGKMNT